MSLWVNRTVLSGSSSVANGTNSHTCTFTAATSGNFLVAVVAGAVTFTTPTGWTLVVSAINNDGLYVFTKTASASESSFTTTHNASNFAIEGVIYEYYAGTVVVGTPGTTTSIPLGGSDNPGPACTGLTGTYTRYAARAYTGTSSTQTTTEAWTLPTIEDYDAIIPKGTNDGIWLGIAYDDGATGTSFTPTATTTSNVNINSEEGVSFALTVATPAAPAIAAPFIAF